MTVSELIEKLKQLPQNYTVFREGSDYKTTGKKLIKLKSLIVRHLEHQLEFI